MCLSALNLPAGNHHWNVFVSQLKVSQSDRVELCVCLRVCARVYVCVGLLCAKFIGAQLAFRLIMQLCQDSIGCDFMLYKAKLFF